MTTKLQRREIYWTAYCCLDGEECELTEKGLCHLIGEIIGDCVWFIRGDSERHFPELCELELEWVDLPDGSPGWPERKEILLRAIEMTY